LSWIFFFLLRSFYAFPSILFICTGQVFSKQFLKLPNEWSTKWSSLSQSTFNEPTTRHLINTHHPKDRTKQRRRIFIVEPSSWLSMYPPVFLLPDTQASFCDPAFSLIGSPKFPNHHHCLPQPSKNPLHIIQQIPPSSLGQPFRFLTQVLFSKQSPTLQLCNIANSPCLLNEWARCTGWPFSKHSRCEWTGTAVLNILIFFILWQKMLVPAIFFMRRLLFYETATFFYEMAIFIRRLFCMRRTFYISKNV
jgi:hypothetical protein